jgi:predicted dienelactone hydrolase
MKPLKSALLVATIICSAALSAQTYQIGSATLTIIDQSRNRSIPVSVYYPANTAGVEVPVASSPYGFPVVGFGHGFVIATESYSWLWEALVPLGYIVVFPKTEGQLLPAPNHAAFGDDIAFCAREVVKRGNQVNSPLFGKVFPGIALMGHSMGGGAAYLGAANYTDIATTVTFAAAETNPSAITAALNITIPSLVIAAAQDCVTPAISNQLPVYNNLQSQTKAYVSITGASHCNFTNGSASTCYLGETFSCFGFGPFISRPVQHERTLQVLVPWLDTYLKSNCIAAQTFSERLTTGAQNNWWSFQQVGADSPECPDQCNTPSIFQISGSPQQGFTLSWNIVPFALGYTVQYRIQGGEITAVNTSVNSFTPTNIDQTATYQYRVRAFCPHSGAGNFSAWNTISAGLNAPIVTLSAVDNMLYISSKETEPVQGLIHIYSIDGRLIKQFSVNALPDNIYSHELYELTKGLYIAHFVHNGYTNSLKFLVQ